MLYHCDNLMTAASLYYIISYMLVIAWETPASHLRQITSRATEDLITFTCLHV